jgi:predicted NBD/HSP70 family sugar kinase
MSSGSIIGIDVGGTKTAIARYDAKSFAVQAEHRMATRAAEGFASVLEDITAALETLRAPDTKAIGIGVPGLVRQPEGVLLRAPNIADSSNVDVKKILEKRCKLPVHIDNDAGCFTLAEARLGASKGKQVVIGITFGTGVGGGIVIHDHVFHGAHGFAGEIGHMLLVPGQPPFETTDKRGDVEQFLSGTAFGKRCLEARDPKDYLDGSVCEFMHPAVFREIAWLITSLTHALDPDMIVLGGSVGHAFTPHINNIKAELKHWLLPGMPVPEIAVGTLKDAATLGAALLTV